MSVQGQIADIFKSLGSIGTDQERRNLKQKVNKYTVDEWRFESLAQVTASGALTGGIGGPVGLAAVIPDIAFCGRVGALGCFGIGHILGREVDYDYDMNMILALWTGLAETAIYVPAGKVGIKLSSKATAKMAGKLVAKAVLKSSSKLGSKLAAKAASKAAAKLVAKLVAKTGVGWIPVIGGIVSAGINIWLVGGMLEAAERYYRGDYVILNDGELASYA